MLQENPPACRRVLWILLVHSCTVCFVFVLSRLSPWRGFLPRLTWTPPLLHLALLRFVLIFPYVVVGSTLPTPRSPPAWFCTSCCHFDGCFRFLVVLAIGLLRRFLYPMLDPVAFAPNTFYTHNLSKYGIFQSRSQYGLFQNPGLHTCFGLNLSRGLNKANVFASKASFTQRAVLHKNCVIHKHNVLHKNHVLAGPVQGLFEAYRIALSMVAGGTRRRRLNNCSRRSEKPTIQRPAIAMSCNVSISNRPGWLWQTQLLPTCKADCVHAFPRPLVRCPCHFRRIKYYKMKVHWGGAQAVRL